jgi:List-Bact-rpt repeat protein
VRRLVLLLIAGSALWLAPGTFAAGWCGTGESSTDRPDVTTGQQIHAVVVVPADGADTFATDAPRLANDVDSLSAWWTGQDLTRVPRFDQAVFPTGTCLDISFLRLTDASAALRPANTAFERVSRALESSGFASTYKKYYVYYDGPSVQTNVCGTGGGDFSSGPAFAIVWLQGCPNVASDAIGAHELVHALGALPAGAPHACPNDPGHPCDGLPSEDVLYPTTDGRPLQQQVLDVGRDDYYGHSGTWDDLQDSLWLRHLDVPQVPLSVAMTGAGSVASDLPGLDCGAPCTTQWDQGAFVTLEAVPGDGQRFVRWTGSCIGNGNCAVTLTQPQSVTAVFGPLVVAVKVTTKGRGTVRCTPACSRSFTAGDPLTLRAVPAKGWKFASWSGACKGSRPVCRPATDFALSARATFRRK